MVVASPDITPTATKYVCQLLDHNGFVIRTRGRIADPERTLLVPRSHSPSEGGMTQVSVRRGERGRHMQDAWQR
jgi:hypothetical protein